MLDGLRLATAVAGAHVHMLQYGRASRMAQWSRAPIGWGTSSDALYRWSGGQAYAQVLSGFLRRWERSVFSVLLWT